MKERFLLPNDVSHPPSQPLGEISDRAFEIAVFEAAKASVVEAMGAEQAARVELTPPSADRGRDVVIRGYTPAELFNLELGDEGVPKQVFVECKLTNKKRLTLEHVAANILQIEPVPNSVFLLVTNGTLTPRAASIIERQCRRVGTDFLLIDAWNIAACLPDIVSQDLVAEEQPDTLVSYQVLKDGKRKDHFFVHFVVRSAPTTTLQYDLSLHSTRDWVSKAEDPSGGTLKAGDLGCWSIELAPKGLTTPRSFTVSVSIDGQRELHDIALVTSDDIARIPLFESPMSSALSKLRTDLLTQQFPRLVHIHGKAGSGKSRLLLELFEEAQAQGLACRFITMLDSGGVFVSTSGFGERDSTRPQEAQLSDFFERLARIETGDRDEFIFIDDVHKATAPILQEIVTFAFGLEKGVSLVAAGRSDPTFRRPDYEAFQHQIAEHHTPDTIRQIILGDMSDSDVRSALSSIFSDDAPGLFRLKNAKTKLRPVDLVHAVHSLLERNQIQWADEERLTLSVADDATTDYFSGDEIIGSILGYRYDHLSKTSFEKFTLAGFFEVLAVIDDPRFSYAAMSALLDRTDVAKELLLLWLDPDDQLSRAVFRHGSLQDYLHTKFYSFDTEPLTCEVLHFVGSPPDDLRSETKAAFALSDGDLDSARALIASFAGKLRVVTNISSLDLEEDDYPHLATLYAVLQRSVSHQPLLQHRCLIARAYLNSHHRAYASGFIDNLRLVGLVSALQDQHASELTVAGVKQLMAHALINSGDSKTALSLMHEVDNFLERHDKTNAAKAIEFDMCDRLQSYYAAQSAFSAARLFFLRARGCAHQVGAPALLSLSFSAEFHLSRYLDVENSVRLAERQLKHAQTGVPERTLTHAKVNSLVANWTAQGTVPDDELSAEFQRLRAFCKRSGFGHLVPRLDYLIAVDTMLKWRAGAEPISIVEAVISKANESARRYGYSEYIWLLASLDLVIQVEQSASPEDVARKAIWLVDHLHDQGLTFVAGDELCFQNTVALSNGLRALHQATDQETAWRYAQKVSFSPLFLPKPSDQRKRLEAAFDGRMLNHIYDPKALVGGPEGYGVILV